jgi:hypothetical protein
MCDFGDLGCGTAAVHHLHSFMIFTWPLFRPHLGCMLSTILSIVSSTSR